MCIRDRYGYLAGTIFLFLILNNLVGRSWRTIPALLCLGCAVYFGALNFRNQPEFSCNGPCPSWSEELAKYESNKNYRPLIPPANRANPEAFPPWKVKLCSEGSAS